MYDEYTELRKFRTKTKTVIRKGRKSNEFHEEKGNSNFRFVKTEVIVQTTNEQVMISNGNLRWKNYVFRMRIRYYNDNNER